MERFIALLFFVAAIYVAATVATEGLDHAFGGVFAGDSSSVAEGVAHEDGRDATDPATTRYSIAMETMH